MVHRETPSSTAQVICTFCVLLLICEVSKADFGRKSEEIARNICLLNCAQCAKALGKYFMPQPCAEYCVSFPFIENKFDCYKLSSVGRYLRRLLVF